MVSSLKSGNLISANPAVVRVSHPASAGPGMGSRLNPQERGPPSRLFTSRAGEDRRVGNQAAAAGSLLPLRRAHLTPAPVSYKKSLPVRLPSAPVEPPWGKLLPQGFSEDLGSRCSRGVHWSLANSGLL